jgi:hypothetical protein
MLFHFLVYPIPDPCFFEGVPPPTHPLLPPCPVIPLHWGQGPSLHRTKGLASPSIDDQQGHPLLHMQLEP